MPSFRLEHKTLLDGRYHVVTSPDMSGLHITAETEEEAFAEAVHVIALIRGKASSDRPREVLTAVEFKAA